VSTPIAFIGLGQMGRLMSANLAAGGYTVQSYDLTGRRNRKSAKEAADGAHILITMLPDGAAVRKAVLAALPGLQAGAVVIDMSSADPGSTRPSARLEEKRLHGGCPVSVPSPRPPATHHGRRRST
jgi:3-hydroxyisobutyrate dehydrogenase